MGKRYTTLWTKKGGVTKAAKERRKRAVAARPTPTTRTVGKVDYSDIDKKYSYAAGSQEDIAARAGAGIAPAAPTTQAPSQPGTSAVTGVYQMKLTTDQAERILTGEVKTTPDILAAVKAGNYEITREGEEAKANLGWEHYAAALGIPMAVQGISSLVANVLGRFAPVGTLTAVGRGGTQIMKNIQINAKTVTLVQKMVAGGASQKTLSSRFGQVLMWAAGASLLGLWGQAEAPEPVTFTMNKIEKLAQKTGDWTLYEEAAEARDDLMNSPMWLSPIFGIPNKIKGIKENADYMDRYVNELREHTAGQGEAGAAGGAGDYMSSPDAWAARDEAKAQMERDNIDYYNEQRTIMLQKEADARRRNMKEEAAFWAAQRAEQMKLEAEEREKQKQFWIDYRIFIMKMQADNRPSTLNFGLL